MRFIDLFAGLGGFHIALKRLGHNCVFASEIDTTLAELYARNFDIKPAGNIRNVSVDEIPEHEILCAGFPCQPFSKAGSQSGFDHPEWGDLFNHVLRILSAHHPQYFILENVPNLERHQTGLTWRTIKTNLEALGYEVQDKRLSPHQFGIPQIRDRMFIAGSRSSLNRFRWPTVRPKATLSISELLDKNPPSAHQLSPQVLRCLEVWQEFLDRFPKGAELPSFPIWSMEFGATYPYEQETPFRVGAEALDAYLGSHGRPLGDLPVEQRFAAIPSHGRTNQEKFPAWKVHFIRQNRDLYERNRDWIDEWMSKILQFPPSLQKLEWNCKADVRNIWNHVIQFRASGVRVKRPTTAPSLVAMTTTQVPIIAWEKRYMTPRECARLQSMNEHELKYLPEASTRAFKALGNAVNANVVEMIAKSLLSSDNASTELRKPKQVELLWELTPA